MIEINLVPDHLRRKRKSSLTNKINIPKESLIGLAGGLLAILFIIHLSLFILTLLNSQSYTQLRKQGQQLQLGKTKIDQIIKDLRDLQQKAKSIEKIDTHENLLWSKKLNEISESIPRGVWLRKISLKDNVFTIDGSSVSKDNDQILYVHTFVNNLKNQPEFLKHFIEFEIDSIQRSKTQMVDLVDFSIKAKVK